MQIEVRGTTDGRLEVVDGGRRDPAPGEVRVAVRRCGICGSDLHFFTGRQPAPAVCPGHEISGVVEATGSGARGVREGDRVTIEPLVRCGTCQHCAAGDYHLCTTLQIYGVTLPGGMASSLVVPDYAAHELPAAVDFEIGALSEPLAVAVHALRLTRLGTDTPLLVLGAGSVGLLTVVAARHFGASFIAATGRYEHQRRLARALGADQVLDPADVRSVAETPHIVVETVGGAADTLRDAVDVVAHGGSIAMVGVFDTTPAFSPLVMLVKEARLIGSMIYNTRGGCSDFAIALDIAGNRGEALRRLVTHTLPLTEVQRAFETAMQKSNGSVKVMLDPGS